jgi:hypothetical protein
LWGTESFQGVQEILKKYKVSVEKEAPHYPLITSSRVESRHRRLLSIAVMNTSRTLNLANNDGEYSDQTIPNERTPLFKKEDARFNDAIPCVSEIDEEAAQALVDKSLPQEGSRNIGGVISILLIGVSTDFSPTDFLFSLKLNRRARFHSVHFKATTDHDLQVFLLQMQILRLSSPRAAPSAANSMIWRTQDG